MSWNKLPVWRHKKVCVSSCMRLWVQSVAVSPWFTTRCHQSESRSTIHSKFRSGSQLVSDLARPIVTFYGTAKEFYPSAHQLIVFNFFFFACMPYHPTVGLFVLRSEITTGVKSLMNIGQWATSKDANYDKQEHRPKPMPRINQVDGPGRAWVWNNGQKKFEKDPLKCQRSCSARFVHGTGSLKNKGWLLELRGDFTTRLEVGLDFFVYPYPSLSK